MPEQTSTGAFPSRLLAWIGVAGLALAVALLGNAARLAHSPQAGSRGEPVALVAGRPIYSDELPASAHTEFLQLRFQAYEVQRQALEDVLDERLLTAEARRRRVSVAALLSREVESRVGNPTEAELRALYATTGGRPTTPFAQAESQLAESWKAARIEERRDAYLAQLRARAEVAILLRPPRVRVGPDPSRLRGSARAPVLIVEFADFQCPFCRRVEPTLEDLLRTHEGRVSLSFRDFPLEAVHPQAEAAAEAARCAGDQGKFWQYHDLLFAGQGKLAPRVLADDARALKLDEARFTACVASGKYRTLVDADVQAATAAGVGGTPTFIINGYYYPGAFSRAELDEAIQEQLPPARTADRRESGGTSPAVRRPPR